MRKIAIIGNGGGGKSTAARALSTHLQIPLFAVDQVQWEPGWVRADPAKVALWHKEILSRPAWIIDGWGSFELMTERFGHADRILFVDYPLATHLAWARKREELSAAGQCDDEPPGCRYADVPELMTETLIRVDRELLPKLRDLLAGYGGKVLQFSDPEVFRAWVSETTSS